MHRIIFEGFLHRGSTDIEKDRGGGKVRALAEKAKYHVGIFEKLMLDNGIIL